MIGRIMSSVIGARVVFGIAVAAVAGLGFVTWRWQAASDDAAHYRQQAQSAEEAAEQNANRAEKIAAERDRLDNLISEQRAQEQERRQRLARTQEKLRDAVEASDCGRRDMPDDVRRGVRGTADDNEGEDDTDDSAE